MLRFHGEILFRQTPVHQKRHQTVQAGAYRHAEEHTRHAEKLPPTRMAMMTHRLERPVLSPRILGPITLPSSC